MRAEHIRRNAVPPNIVGGWTGRHWTGVSGHSAGQRSDHAYCPVHVGNLH